MRGQLDPVAEYGFVPPIDPAAGVALLIVISWTVAWFALGVGVGVVFG